MRVVGALLPPAFVQLWVTAHEEREAAFRLDYRLRVAVIDAAHRLPGDRSARSCVLYDDSGRLCIGEIHQEDCDSDARASSTRAARRDLRTSTRRCAHRPARDSMRLGPREWVARSSCVLWRCRRASARAAGAPASAGEVCKAARSSAALQQRKPSRFRPSGHARRQMSRATTNLKLSTRPTTATIHQAADGQAPR